ncbi:adenylate/guanylate cyclase domain-containing protein [Pelagibius sp.]|uniref:adenylate/guanylate cyclase domain-containing protein n=1 Tax=Pelagibius sp. TaxID=1931238 RepID=UPI002616F913|nr:adenylate/guanylate cyclase domain-containing protein [Pelagibius sp.]
MAPSEIDDLLADLDRQNRLLARQLERREQALQLLQDIQRGNTHLQKSLLSEIEAEKEKSDRLLQNILPADAIRRLGAGESLIADAVDCATVVFADLVGFTPLSAEMTASELVQSLNTLYSAFDDAAQRAGVEKIKTIGDAYLACAGLDGQRPDHAIIAARFALEIRDFLRMAKAQGTLPWRMRIGLHSGGLTAGVIGKHKFAYDIWGDTVNVAARIQSVCAPEAVLVSEDTAALLADGFDLSDEGEVVLKGRGKRRVFRLEHRA